MKKCIVKIKRFICGLSGHKYRKMHIKYNKKMKRFIIVYKCMRCEKIITKRETRY